MSRGVLSVVAAFALLMAPGLARAQAGATTEASDKTEASETPEATKATEDLLASMRMDDLGRVFPDPEILQRARLQSGFGVGLSVAGVGLLFTGMMVGSAAARGELTLPPSPFPSLIQSDRIDQSSIDGFIFIGATAGIGVLLAFIGVPMMSVGMFTTKQMLRTIKGAEKVPRTVANERVYWRGLQTQHSGQAIGIAGGAFVAFGIIALVGQGATVGTQIYTPAVWAVGPAILGTGVGVLILGIKMTQKGRATQKQTWDAVDPRRQKVSAIPGIPMPILARRPGPTGRQTWAGVGWSFYF
jgi:hypothetical protein